MEPVKFSKAESEFILKNEACRLASITPDGKPHVVPICYIYQLSSLLTIPKPIHNILPGSQGREVSNAYLETIKGLIPKSISGEGIKRVGEG